MNKQRSAGSTAVSLSLRERLLNRIDERAAALGMNRSSYFSYLAAKDISDGGPLTIIPLDDVEPPSEEVKKKLRKTKFPDRK